MGIFNLFKKQDSEKEFLQITLNNIINLDNEENPKSKFNKFLGIISNLLNKKDEIYIYFKKDEDVLKTLDAMYRYFDSQNFEKALSIARVNTFEVTFCNNFLVDNIPLIKSWISVILEKA